MKERRFIQCDVFADTPLRGNGLAVVLDGTGLTDRAMQDFAAWTNLSETTFLLPPTQPGADYRVRIFTPVKELAFAGHPTLGSCAAWLHAGGTPRHGGTVVQECRIGNVTIDVSGQMPAFVAPATTVSAMPDDVRHSILAGLGLDEATVMAAAILDNGSTWHVLELDEARRVMEVQAARVADLPGLGIGLLAASLPGTANDFDIRMLSDRSPRFEDPITGSLNAAVGMWLQQQGRLDRPTVMAQGARVGRDGQVHLRPGPAGPGEVLVAGRTHILIDGKVRL